MMQKQAVTGKRHCKQCLVNVTVLQWLVNVTGKLALASTALSLMMYSYVVSSTLNLVARIWLCMLRRMAGEPLYATTTTDGAHFSNSSTQLDSVLQVINHNNAFKLNNVLYTYTVIKLENKLRLFPFPHPNTVFAFSFVPTICKKRIYLFSSCIFCTNFFLKYLKIQ
jgi:hypothetical protein